MIDNTEDNRSASSNYKRNQYLLFPIKQTLPTYYTTTLSTSILCYSLHSKFFVNNNNNSRISIPPSVVTSEAVAEPVRSRKSAIVG